MEHFLDELKNDKENIIASIKEVDRGLLMKTDVALHEFIQWPTYFIESNKDWRYRTAFLVHHYDFFDVAHRALMESLTGYYSNGFVLLRSAYELMVRGALWECLAHTKFREKAEVLRGFPVNIYGHKKTIIDWLNDCCNADPTLLDNMDAFSCIVLDKISPLFSNKKLNKLIPNLKTIMEQLTAWGMFNSIDNPMTSLYDVVYWNLSKDSHGVPDRTLIGRRLAGNETIFEHKILPNELNDFCLKLGNVVDVGFVLQINILGDLLKDPMNIKILETKLQIIKDLNLPITTAKIEDLIVKNE